MKVRKNLVLILVILISISSLSWEIFAQATKDSKQKYEVRDLSGGVSPIYFSNFKDANVQLKKSSITSVILEDGEIVATQPKESYVYFKSSGTNNIYKNKNNLSEDTLTYVTGHYKMHYYGTEQVGDKLVAEVEINGGRGYTDVKYIKFLPFYNREFTDDYYFVRNTRGFNEISVYYHKVNGYENGITYAAAPDWLKPGKYYSPDGIHFYYDRSLNKPVYDGEKIGEFYAYYQWLPVRSLSSATSKDIRTHLTDVGAINQSALNNKEHLLIDLGKKYGTNSTLLYAQAALESNYGRHEFAKEGWNNLFGWNAFDSNPEKATKYESLSEAIEIHSAVNIGDYMDVGDWRHEGLSFGNKGSGITVRYASDPYYGQKIAQLAYSLDRQRGFQDYNSYNLAKIDDYQDLNVRKKPNTDSAIYYTTKPNKINQIRTYLGNENGFMKTNLSMPLQNGEVKYSTKDRLLPINLEKEFGYMSLDYLTKQQQHGPIKGKIFTEDVYTSSELKSYLVDTSSEGHSVLNVRSDSTTNSNTIATLNHGDKIQGYFVSNGWVKIQINGKTGYVNGHFLEQDFGAEETKPEDTGYKLGDVNNDGEIDGFDMMAIKRHYLGIKKLDNKAAKAADVNKDGEIDGFDMMAVKRHYLNIKLIVE